jgi:hypothetical protein
MSDKFIPAGDKPMKIVYSKHGRFELSTKATEYYKNLLMADCLEKINASFGEAPADSTAVPVVTLPDFSSIPRNDTLLVAVVEKLGNEASAHDSNLVVKEIPANTMYSITNGGGNEWPCLYAIPPSCDA